MEKELHKQKEALTRKLYKVTWGPAYQRVSQYVRLYNEIEKVKKGAIEAMGGLVNAKEQATKAAEERSKAVKEARIYKQKEHKLKSSQEVNLDSREAIQREDWSSIAEVLSTREQVERMCWE